MGLLMEAVEEVLCHKEDGARIEKSALHRADPFFLHQENRLPGSLVMIFLSLKIGKCGVQWIGQMTLSLNIK